MKISVRQMLDFSIIAYMFSIVLWDDGQNSITSIIRLFVFGFAFIHFVSQRRFPKTAYIFYTGFFLLYGWFSYFWALKPSNTFVNALTITYIFIIDNIIMAVLIENKNNFILYCKAMFWASLLKAAMVFMKNGFFAYLNARQGEGLVNANSIGMASAIAVCLGIIILETVDPKIKILYRIGIVFSVGIIILSASRKSLLILLIPLVIYILLKEKNPLKVFRNIIIIVAAVYGIFYLMMNVPLLYDLGGNRIESFLNSLNGGETDGSTSFRIHMIEWGIEWFHNRPYFGHGLMNYKALLGTMGTWAGTEGTYAHNNYIELLVDVGIVGTVIYYSLYASLLFKGIRKIKERNLTRLILLGLLVAILISEYGLVTYYDKSIQAVLVLIWFAINYNLPEKLEGRAVAKI